MFKFISISVAAVLIVAGGLLVPSLGASEGGLISIETDGKGTQTCTVDGVVTDCEQAVNLDQAHSESEQPVTVTATGEGEELFTEK